MIFEKGSFIKITENRCLNQWHSGVKCKHCIEHCPADAIFLYENQVYMNKDKCNGCGLCLSECPTQVFRSNQWDETTIIDDIKREDWKTTEFFCGRHSAPYKKNRDRDNGAVQLPACLGIISRAAWYEIGLITKVELQVDQCEACPMKNVLSRLDYNLRIAAEWMEASGRIPVFNLIYQGNKGKTKKSLAAIEAGLKVTSRRDLFLSLVNKGRQITGNRPDRKESFLEEINQVRQNSCLSDWQRRLAEVYPANMIEGSPPAYWPVIKMNDKCVNCGMCSRFCPSGALQIVVTEGVCTHYFTSGLCLDCRSCELFCQQKAISRGKEKVEKPFETTIISVTPVVKCQRCGSVTVDSSNHLCFWCSEETSIDSEFNDICNNLFTQT
ncbi:MAG: 4Fe-4S binding protein [Syntrophomonadaceae bacterium]|jgi:ferredoxin|nr:4Fe-4S binding protein [Syntrophomonadaceae bacterium]